MEIVNIKIDKLKAYEKNAKKHDQTQIDNVAESIKQFDMVQPLVVDKNDVVIIGHCRLLACKQLGMKEVPCVRADTLTDKQVAKLRLLDNKLNESDWDLDLLSEELADLDLDDFELDWGLDDLEPEKEVQEDDFDVESAIPEEPKAKYGDIYQLGEHRLMCGDSTKEEDVAKLMEGGVIKCVFTSPPYNMGGGMYENYKDNLGSNEYIEFNLKVIRNIKKYLKGFVFWNISYNKNSRDEFLRIALKICEELNFKEMIIWNKKKAMPIISNEIMTRTYEDIFLYESEDENRFEVINLYESERGLLYNKRKNKIIKNYWEINVDSNTQLDNHKACYPVRLPAEGIKYTTEQGDIVFEPFGGSGTDIIACEQLNRKCYCMEFEPIYVDVCIKRWEDFTGKKAVKIN